MWEPCTLHIVMHVHTHTHTHRHVHVLAHMHTHTACEVHKWPNSEGWLLEQGSICVYRTIGTLMNTHSWTPALQRHYCLLVQANEVWELLLITFWWNSSRSTPKELNQYKSPHTKALELLLVSESSLHYEVCLARTWVYVTGCMCVYWIEGALDAPLSLICVCVPDWGSTWSGFTLKLLLLLLKLLLLKLLLELGSLTPCICMHGLCINM